MLPNYVFFNNVEDCYQIFPDQLLQSGNSASKFFVPEETRHRNPLAVNRGYQVDEAGILPAPNSAGFRLFVGVCTTVSYTQLTLPTIA